MKKILLLSTCMLIMFATPAQQLAKNDFKPIFERPEMESQYALTPSLAKNVTNALSGMKRDEFDDANNNLRMKRIVFGTIFAGLTAWFVYNLVKVVKENK